jgi:hypothetical protein
MSNARYKELTIPSWEGVHDGNAGAIHLSCREPGLISGVHVRISTAVTFSSVSNIIAHQDKQH